MPNKMNHIEYPKQLKKKSNDELQFIIKDCREAIEAMPNGGNASYYADEIHYCNDELRRRNNKN